MDARSNVRKVRVNSTPEKIPKNQKWMLFKVWRVARRCSTSFTFSVPVPCFSDLGFSDASTTVPLGETPRVSGNASAKKRVSAVSKTRVRIAGVAYILSSMPLLPRDKGTGREAKYAPIGGPMIKQMANAIPTCAKALARF